MADPLLADEIPSGLDYKGVDDSTAELSSRFKWPEYVVFVLMLVISAGIGIYYGFVSRKKNTTSEFLMASKSMSTFPAAMSLIASFMSAITLLGTPAEIYLYGTQYFVIILSFPLVMAASAYLYLPVFWHFQPTSAYEYLELRFSKSVRLLGSAIFSTQMCIYMAIVVYAPALAISQVTGINVWAAVTGILLVCIFYTALGGMKAVMWTDTFQVIIMFGSMLIVVVKGAVDVGGNAFLFKTIKNGSRVEFFNFDLDPRERHTVWGLIIGGYFTWIPIYGVNQSQVQRYLTVPKINQARNALWINAAGLMGLIGLCCYAGLVLFGKYHGCDPILSKQVSTSDQIFPLFVMETLGNIPGLPGLFVAGIFSGALSTVSSGLNSLAAIVLMDFVPLFRKELTEAQGTNVSKAVSIVFGFVCFGLTFVAAQLGGVLQAALSIFGMIGGPLHGVFALGMFLPWANWKGALSGTACSLVFMFWLGFGANVKQQQGQLVVTKRPLSVNDCHKPVAINPPSLGQAGGILEFYRTSYIWYSMIGCTIVITVGMAVSFFTGFQDPRKLDPALISTPIDRFMKMAFPGRFRRKIGWELGEGLSMEDDKIQTTEEMEPVEDLEELGGLSSDAQDSKGSNEVVTDESGLVDSRRETKTSTNEM